MMLRPRDARVAAGGATLAGAALLLGAAVAGALRSDRAAPPPAAPAEGPSAAAPAQAATPAAQVPVREAAAPRPVSDEVLERAVESAPFSPERRPSEAYLLPEERIVPTPVRTQAPPPPPAPAFRVLGTIVGGDGGIAVMEAPGEPPRVITVGEEILGFRLSRIEQGRVLLGDAQGRNLSVVVPEVAPRTAAAASDTGRGQQNQNPGFTARARALVGGPSNVAADVVNKAMAQLRQQSGGGDVRMEMKGDRVILTGADGSTREITIGGSGGRGGDTYDWVIAAPPAPATPAGIQRRPGGGGR